MKVKGNRVVRGALINKQNGESFDAVTVSSALGHSAAGTTGIYLHVFQEYQAKTGEAISAALNLKAGKNGNVQTAVYKK